MMAIAVVCSIAIPQTFAWSPSDDPTTCYTISANNNVKLYTDTSLSKYYRSRVSSNYEIKLQGTGNNGTYKVQARLVNGKVYTGYIKTSDLLTTTSSHWKIASGTIKTYRRNNTNTSYGKVYAKDMVLVFNKTKGNFTQIRYPVNGGLKIAWITNSDANKYLASNVGVKNTSYIYEFASALNTSKVLDVYYNSSRSGANIWLCDKRNTNAQYFILTSVGSGYYKIRHYGTNMYLTAASGRKGANVYQSSYTGSNNQKWMFYPLGNNYCIIMNKSGYALDVCGGQTYNGVNVQLYTPNSTAAQRWKLRKVN